MDIGTGLTLLGSAQLVNKLLGPTADYFGSELQTWTKQRTENVKRIFDNATKKLGDRINDQGRISPRILKGIIEDGSYCEDNLSIEYFGGVLASSRSGVSRDDRGTVVLSLLSRLSAYQIRTHYLCYQVVNRLFNGSYINPNLAINRVNMEAYMPMDIYLDGMGFDDEERKKLNTLFSHIWGGLGKEQLIENYFWGGEAEMSNRFVHGLNSQAKEGIIFQPTMTGIELFLWAYGLGDLGTANITHPEIDFGIYKEVILRDGFAATRHPSK